MANLDPKKYLDYAGLQTFADAIKALIDSANGDTAAVKALVDTLIGDDAAKSVRTIANEELAAQLLSDKADADFKTLQELAAWLEDHPEDAAAMNAAIAANAAAIGVASADAEGAEGAEDYKPAVTATGLTARVEALEGLMGEESVADQVKAEKERAEGAEKDLKDAIDAFIPITTDEINALFAPVEEEQEENPQA